MNNRARNRLGNVATVNEEIAAQGVYRTDSGETVSIAAPLEAARAGTVSYAPHDLDALLRDTARPGRMRPGTTVEVTGEGSVQAARRLHRAGGTHVGVLNFASARNPGGGYLGGARAQEEDLCRSALLYSCLLRAPDYYEAHRASADLRYSHRVIFSPRVPVIRDDRSELTAEPCDVSFLTSPAPNAGELRRRVPSDAGAEAQADLDREIAGLLADRAVRVLAVAARHGVRELVLGAWGCGVFRNDPGMVAAAFDTALEAYGAAFDHVVFAVWDRNPESANRAAFEARFGTV